jgi:thiamine transporter ThiT
MLHFISGTLWMTNQSKITESTLFTLNVSNQLPQYLFCCVILATMVDTKVTPQAMLEEEPL